MDTITKLDPDTSTGTYTVGNTSAQSAVIITGSGKVRIATTTHAHIRFGANPTATENDPLMPTDHVEVFSFKSGDKVAFIGHGAGSGEISITAID
jgi:hypothetical protein